MKNLILLLFTLTLFWGNAQQIVNMCEYSKKDFTYTTNSQGFGIFTWDINGQIITTTSNSVVVDWSLYENGVYTISVYFENSDGCYSDPIEYNIFITDCNESFIYAPNAFTPDGDSYNDEWKPIAYNIREGNYLIFNRWGEVIFESYNLEVGWPGTYNGSIVKDGTYVYVIEYVNAIGVREKITGHINLLK